MIRRAYDVLETGGLFLLMERVQIDAERLTGVYAAMWERLERVADVKSGWDPERYLQRLRDKADHVATLDDHLAWLRETGFAAACLDLRLDRALFVGVKAG